jgi:hypothetical protein
MKKLAMVMAGAVVFVTEMAGSAFAAYTDSPPPEAVVEGAGGGAGAGAGEAAFTGGDVSTAVIVAFALVVAGVVALLMARRRATASDS